MKLIVTFERYKESSCEYQNITIDYEKLTIEEKKQVGVLVGKRLEKLDVK